MFVLALTAVKDAIEDYAKHVADAIENSRTTARLESYNIATPTTITSAGVRVGALVLPLRPPEPMSATIVSPRPRGSRPDATGSDPPP